MTSQKIGVIAEEHNDVDVLEELISKMVDESTFSIKRFAAHGCGKLRKKCGSWAENLLARGCTHLIVLHDCDRYDSECLRIEVEALIAEHKFKTKIVLIPKEELEAWLLCDGSALKKIFNIRKMPALPGKPETVESPKEFLGKLVRRHSKTIYLNTTHNKKIAAELRLGSLNKCPSFKPFPDFVKNMKLK